MKKAFITGVTGQDGSYLLEFLLDKGYEVHAIIRRSSVFTSKRIPNKYWNHENFKSYHGDLTDSSNLHTLILKIKPDEVYNLAAQSHVGVSFDVPEYTGEVDAIGTIRLLNAIRDTGVNTKFYQASTSELFGGLPGTEPQSEITPFYPKSPYGAAKLYSYWVTVNYRESYNMFACNGILFNHESPVRGETFVTRKITRAASRIVLGMQDKLYLGNLDAKRDWGHAKDYVKMMWMILQAEKPEDWVIATGKTTSIRDFVIMAFDFLGIKIKFKGEGVNEVGTVEQCANPDYMIEIGKEIIKVDSRYFRPTEVDLLIGDASKAQNKLGWKATTSLNELVNDMMESDLKLMIKEQFLIKNGF